MGRKKGAKRIKKGWKSLAGDVVNVAPKAWGPGARHRYWIGGTLFGLGWGLAH